MLVSVTEIRQTSLLVYVEDSLVDVRFSIYNDVVSCEIQEAAHKNHCSVFTMFIMIRGVVLYV